MHKVLIESKHARRHPVGGAILTKITLEDEYGPHKLAKMAFLPSFSLIRCSPCARKWRCFEEEGSHVTNCFKYS
jgi:hypothetical protein